MIILGHIGKLMASSNFALPETTETAA